MDILNFLSDVLNELVASNAVRIAVFFTVAYLIHRFSDGLAGRMCPIGDITQRRNPRRVERLETIQELISSAISFIGFLLAILLSLNLFVDTDTLVWVIGLFSAAFGLGARPFIADYLTGISFIFEDSFDVGDKIEIPLFPQRVEGVVEQVSLRITRVRGVDGELYTMPNGDIRLLRNFSRGKFSSAKVTIKVKTHHLDQAIDLLEALGEEAMTLLPNLLAPWQVISTEQSVGQQTELVLTAKARFGKAAELRPRLMQLVQGRLRAAEIELGE
jgi:moderate conductance mechanosensitive channel